MKTFLSLTLVAIVLLSTLVFTSCDIESILGGGVQITPNPEKEARTAITEMEWLKAFNINNYSLEIISGNEKYHYDITEKAFFGELFEKQDGSFVSSEKVYLDVTNGYQIEQTENGWVGSKIELTGEEIHEMIAMFVPEINFADLVYQEATKSYLYKNEEIIFDFYFEDGKIVRMEGMSTLPDDDSQIILSNVGTTTVELPEYSVDKYAVSYDEWNANMNAKNYTVDMKATITQTANGEEIGRMESSVVLKQGTDAIYQIADGTEHYSVLVGDTWCKLALKEDGKYVVDAYYDYDPLDSIADMMSTFTNGHTSYHDYNYNAQSKSYSYSFKDYERSGTFYVYFEDGEITKIEIRFSISSSGSIQEWNIVCDFSDVGTTVVEVPEFTDDSSTPDKPSDNRYTVTEEEFYSKLNANNFTVVIDELDTIMMVTPNAYYSAVGENRSYLIHENGEVFMISEINGVWSATPYSYSWVDYRISGLFEYYFSDLSFENFEYNDYSHFYEMNVNVDGTDRLLLLSFYNGEIRSAYFSIGDDGYNLTFSNVGTTVVEVPEVTIPTTPNDGYAVTAAVWHENINMRNYTLFIMQDNELSKKVLQDDYYMYYYDQLNGTEGYDHLMMVSYINYLQYHFDSSMLQQSTYTYDTDLHAYCTEADGYTVMIFFENNVLKYIAFFLDDYNFMTFIFTDVGTTFVESPVVGDLE